MQHITVVASPDAPGNLRLSDFCSCLCTLTRLMNLNDKPLPRILVMHVSDRIADSFGVDQTGVIRHNRRVSGDPPMYYEIWVVGIPDLSQYASALLGILEDYFLLDLSSQDRQETLESVVWTISADNLSEAVVQ